MIQKMFYVLVASIVLSFLWMGFVVYTNQKVEYKSEIDRENIKENRTETSEEKFMKNQISDTKEGLLLIPSNVKYDSIKKFYTASNSHLIATYKDNVNKEIKIEITMLADGTFFLYHGSKNEVAYEGEYKLVDKTTIDEFKKTHKEEIEFYKAIQNLFYNQWHKLKKYANDNGIKIIGDIPIYSAYDSAEVWAMPKNFYLDENKLPIDVAGVPPDGFSASGQLWGNPLYNYEYIKENNYKYFIDKFEHLKELYDVIRIDHFRGFDSYYAIPYGRTDAVEGRWVDAPGKELFDKVKAKLGDVEIIVEDLGFLTESVRELLKHTGFPGMKVLEFAFDSRDKNNTEYLPHTYPENSVAYIGTHDNDTFVGWLNSINENDRNYAKEYLELKEDGSDHYRAIRVLYESKSNLAIATIQDLLGIGTEGRINVPSTISDKNWSFRFKKDEIADSVKEFFKGLTIKTHRES